MFFLSFEQKFLFVYGLTLFLVVDARNNDIVYAVNCGGDSHTDVRGIQYQGDPTAVGIASDYGKNLRIERVAEADQLLYQTEKYDTNTFGYDIPVYEDGNYVLVLKFSEVWFSSPNQKVFDVILNHQHTIVSNLDIFAKVGRGVAHDEIVAFTISKGTIKVNGETSKVEKNLRVDFAKGANDNPKINAFYLMKGNVDDVEPLPPVPGVSSPEEEEEDEEESRPEEKPTQRRYKRSEQPAQDPYATEDARSTMLPILIAIAVAIPSLFCLCRL